MLPYDPTLKARARELRNKSTLAEVLLWKHLKGRQRRGFDFHRQRPIDRYIIDFFAPRLMLAIEIDGNTHHFKAKVWKMGSASAGLSRSASDSCALPIAT